MQGQGGKLARPANVVAGYCGKQIEQRGGKLQIVAMVI
jgi:hypothetical protein